MCTQLHTVCKITHHVWNKNYIHDYTGVCRVQYGKKFLSLEKFYTNIVTGVSDYYEVWLAHRSFWVTYQK